MRKIKRTMHRKAALGIALGLTGLLFGPHAAFAGEDITYTGTETLQTIGGHANSFGPSDLANVSGNTITINCDVLTAPSYAYGAYSDSTDVSNNNVILSSGTVINRIYGGYTAAGNATNNSVAINDQTAGDDVYGGYAGSGSATGNTVTVSGDYAVVNGDIYGGCAYSGSATSNSVTISGGAANYNVYGGVSVSSNATGNTVSISDGSVGSDIYGGYSYSGSATDNTVTVSGGTASGNVYGGYAASGSSTGNTVTISNGTVSGIVYGGGASGNATDNTVIISGGSVGIYVAGGYAYSGNATNNSVTISGGTASGNVYGGWSDAGGNATGNTVIISGGSISGIVYGGYSASGSATGNTITISGTPALGILYGGYVDSGSGDTWTGNTLNVESSGMSATGVANFQYYNFYLPSTIASGDTMLTVTNAATISNSTISIYLQGSTTLQSGSTIILLHSNSSLTAANITNSTVSTYLGIATAYDFTLSTDFQNLYATYSGTHQNAQVKALSEGQVSGAAFLTQGADMLSGQGLQTARSAAAGATGQISSFAALGGSSLRYETGSHVDVNGISFVAGAAKEKTIGQDKLTNGLFLEHGWGSYSTYNSFSNATSVKGSGDTQYFGAGWLGRRQKNSGQYVEGSIRTGQVSNKFNSSDIGAAGTTSSYDVSSPYYGLHIGIGKETDIGKNKKCDVYARALWTHQNGSSATVQGDSFQFDAVDSLRGQAGVKWSYKTNESTTLHTGLAYQYEFDGNAGATVNGSAVESPSMQGGTGIIEIGLTKENKTGKGPILDIGLQGFCGKTRGIAGAVQASWKF